MSIAELTSLKRDCAKVSDLCQSLVKEVLELARNGEPEDPEGLVHRVRVLTKRLRAAWSLVRGVASKDQVKQRRSALRALSGVLAGSRDDAVLRELCQSLMKRSSPEEAGVFARLADSFEAADSGQAISMSELCRALEEEQQAWESVDWGESSHCRGVVSSRIRKSLKRVKKDTRRVLKSHDPEEWHEWRKAIKQLRYQRDLVRELEGGPPSEFDREIRELGTLLGKRNDLANLTCYASSAPFLSREDKKRARSAVRKKEKAVIKKCRRRGRDLSRHWK